MKHTTGPWKVSSCDVHPHHEIIAESGRRIATQTDYHDGQDKANALLIAAAPELLDALTGLLEWGRDHLSPVHEPEAHTLLVASYNAIAKAKGE